MKNEYIAGDLVKYLSQVVKIVEVYQDGTCYFGNETMCGQQDCKDAEPIPLTPEILEKNGWKFLKHHERDSYDDVSWSSYHKPAETNISLIFYQEEEAFFPFLYAQEISEKPIRYIHQLQHLLFGLGLNSKMEV